MFAFLCMYIYICVIAKVRPLPLFNASLVALSLTDKEIQ